MQRKQIKDVVDDFQSATEGIVPRGDCVDLNEFEAAIAARQATIARLSSLVADSADLFTDEDLERIRECHARGIQAMNELARIRCNGWIKSNDFLSDESQERPSGGLTKGAPGIARIRISAHFGGE